MTRNRREETDTVAVTFKEGPFASDRLIFTILLGLGLAGLYLGWKIFWFMTDDASTDIVRIESRWRKWLRDRTRDD